MRRLGFSRSRYTILISAIILSGCDSFPTIPDPNVRYIAFGDSTTDGPADRQYVDFLPNLLGESSDAFANEGRSGETSEEGLDRLRSLLAAETYPNATTLIYWESGNDLSDFIKDYDPFLLSSPAATDFSRGDELAAALDDAEANVGVAISEARVNGLAVFVATYAPLAPGVDRCDSLPLDILFPGQATNGNAYLDALNLRLVLVAELNGATVVDIAAIGDELRGNSANYENCNHLSDLGNERAAAEFAAAIAR